MPRPTNPSFLRDDRSERLLEPEPEAEDSADARAEEDPLDVVDKLEANLIKMSEIGKFNSDHKAPRRIRNMRPVPCCCLERSPTPDVRNDEPSFTTTEERERWRGVRKRVRLRKKGRQCSEAWFGKVSRFGAWWTIFRTSSFVLRKERAELVATQNIMLHGNEVSVIKLLSEMQARYRAILKEASDDVVDRFAADTVVKSSRSFQMKGETHSVADNDGIDLQLASRQLTMYFVHKLRNTDWLESIEFEELCSVIDRAPDADQLEELLSRHVLWKEKVHAYCRGGAETFILLNVEIARLDGMLKTKADLSMRLLLIVCSAIITYNGQLIEYVEQHTVAASDIAVFSLVTCAVILFWGAFCGMRGACSKDAKDIILPDDGEGAESLLGSIARRFKGNLDAHVKLEEELDMFYSRVCPLAIWQSIEDDGDTKIIVWRGPMVVVDDRNTRNSKPARFGTQKSKNMFWGNNSDSGFSMKSSKSLAALYGQRLRTLNRRLEAKYGTDLTDLPPRDLGCCVCDGYFGQAIVCCFLSLACSAGACYFIHPWSYWRR